MVELRLGHAVDGWNDHADAGPRRRQGAVELSPLDGRDGSHDRASALSGYGRPGRATPNPRPGIIAPLGEAKLARGRELLASSRCHRCTAWTGEAALNANQ